jgi:hypothetical protein
MLGTFDDQSDHGGREEFFGGRLPKLQCHGPQAARGIVENF